MVVIVLKFEDFTLKVIHISDYEFVESTVNLKIKTVYLLIRKKIWNVDLEAKNKAG